MTQAKADTLRDLDAMIAEVRKGLADAQRAAERVQGLTADLQALERSRALLAGTNGHVPTEEPLPLRTPVHRTVVQTPPQTELVLGILRTATRPMTVEDVMNAVRTRVPGAKRMTIAAHLSRFAEKKVARRTALGTYEIVK